MRFRTPLRVVAVISLIAMFWSAVPAFARTVTEDAVAVAANNIIAEGLALQKEDRHTEAIARFDAVVRMVSTTPLEHISIAANFYAGRSYERTGPAGEMARRFDLVARAAPNGIIGKYAASKLAAMTRNVPAVPPGNCGLVFFILFFEADGKISASGSTDLARVAAQANACPQARLRIVGSAGKHETGPGMDARRLAVARGNWARDRLIAMGVGAERLIASGAIAASIFEIPVGVVEPQDRRVDFYFE